MRDLTFFTSSQTKIAHARYIAESRKIRIKGFRQRTYHAGYEEPRLNSRDEILAQSYVSALEQIGKARLPAASHAFILEDTSVRIDALSDSENEVPGVDIKYWMEDRPFESLDASLRAYGNDRGASVRSDILLHIPANFAKSWGVESAYLVFTSEQRGNIIDKEHIFASNPVYPWLDNRSFYKWFVPEGCEGPLGALPIAHADQVDFRRGAFEQLFDFLEARRYFPTPTTQLAFQLDRKPNILLCGYTCAGKTTASQYLARRYGYLHVEASDFMHLSYYYRHGFRGGTPIGDFAEYALAEKPTIAAERATEYMLDNLAEPLVISGFCAPEEVIFLNSIMRVHGKEFTQHFVEADEASRFARLRASGLILTFESRFRQGSVRMSKL
ncbi:MAG: non-canonical purine NTP pyrophosphatase [Novosphingobium sp.]